MKIQYLPFLLIGFLCLSACGSSKNVVREPEVDLRPDWVKSRPHSSADYIGIGYGSKNLPDYQESAKRSALNDLASEIQVRIEGNSLLYSMERNYQLREEYLSNIRTSTKADLEGYDRVDSWEDENRYWVYYRLSKAKYASIREQKKRAATDRSLDFHRRASEAFEMGNFTGALDMEVKALLAIREYWGEENRVNLDGREMLLDNEEYGKLRKYLDQIRLKADPATISLNYGNSFRTDLVLTSSLDMGRGERPLARVPLDIRYQGIEKKVAEKRSTGPDGSVQLSVVNARYEEGNNDLVAKVRMKELLPSAAADPWMEALISDVSVPEIRVPIEIDLPRMIITGKEKNLGSDVDPGVISSRLKNLLSDNGFRLVNDPGLADYALEVVAATRQGGTANGFYISWLDMELQVRDLHQNKIIYQDNRQDIKGIQLDHPKAGRDAFKRAAGLVEDEMLADLMKALF